ncbi:hypothetical protein ABZ559_04975 [Streptococcus sp. ZY19097]|uniref:hypothetical protein n=1 Tax=Streptococcus sp. ZY19097 TaxID=3231906 RepID=UPI0034599C03
MSENIKEALEYAVDLANNENKVIEVNGKSYYDAQRYRMIELEPKLYPKTLALNTLDSLVDYLKSGLNGLNEQKLLVVVEGPLEVSVYSEDDERAHRSRLATVEAITPNLHFGQYEDAADFNVILQSKFIDSDDRDVVIEFASALKIENGSEIEDNGVSQMATVKNGVASLAKGKAPNPVTLRPYRTFGEVEQPASKFIFRINKHAEMALFEADGGKWRLEAINNVADYLKGQLTDQTNLTILA